MRLPIYSLLMVFGVVLSGFAQSSETDALHPSLYQLHFQQGLEHYRQGDVESARPAFLHALFLNPEHSDTNYYLGLMAYADNNYSAAISFLEKARTRMPEHMQLLYWLGKAYWDKGLADGAIESYRAAVEADPEQRDPYSLYALENLAEVYTRTERLQESLDAYQAALQRESREAWITKIRNQIDELYLTMGTYEDDGDTRYNSKGEPIGGIGEGNMRTNQYFEIARHTTDPVKESTYYAKSIEADPGMYQSHFNLGWSLTKLGRYSDAILALLKSDEIWRGDQYNNPDSIIKVDAHAFLALSYVELGEPEKALDYAEAALQIQPNYYYGLLYRARALTRFGRAQDAVPILAELVEANPDEAELLHALSEAYRGADKPIWAAAALTQAVHSQVDSDRRALWAEQLTELTEQALLTP